MVTNDNDLFKVSEAGGLNLAVGKHLDFETTESHTITVEVSDDELKATAKITITVIDVNENIAPVIEKQSFTIAEDVLDDAEIGTVAGTDSGVRKITFQYDKMKQDLTELIKQIRMIN